MENKDEVIGYVCALCKTPSLKNSKYCVGCGQWLLSDISKPKEIYKHEIQLYFGETVQTYKTYNKSLLAWFWIIFMLYYVNSDINTRMALGFFLTASGIINLIYPIPLVFNIKNRKQAIIIFIIGIVLLVTAKPH